MYPRPARHASAEHGGWLDTWRARPYKTLPGRYLGTLRRHRIIRCGAVAQLGERVVRNDEVSGSIPLSSTRSRSAFDRLVQKRFGGAQSDIAERTARLHNQKPSCASSQELTSKPPPRRRNARRGRVSQSGTYGPGTIKRLATVFRAPVSDPMHAARSAIRKLPATVWRQNH